MHKRFQKALEQASEFRVLIALLFVIIKRMGYAIPNIKPRQLIMPINIMQIITLIYATAYAENIIITFTVGNLIIIGIALLPFLLQPPKPKRHWVK